jgi:hypothetical protein
MFKNMTIDAKEVKTKQAIGDNFGKLRVSTLRAWIQGICSVGYHRHLQARISDLPVLGQ